MLLGAGVSRFFPFSRSGGKRQTISIWRSWPNNLSTTTERRHNTAAWLTHMITTHYGSLITKHGIIQEHCNDCRPGPTRGLWPLLPARFASNATIVLAPHTCVHNASETNLGYHLPIGCIQCHPLILCSQNAKLIWRKSLRTCAQSLFTTPSACTILPL